jgi:thiol:disulfide interchange protein
MRALIVCIIVATLAVIAGLMIGCDKGQPAGFEYPPPGQEVPQRIPKPATYDEAINIAQQYNTQLFLIFTASWCEPCKKMKAEVWPDERVQGLLKDYVIYVVDVDRERAVANGLRVRTIPAYGVFDVSSGTVKSLQIASGSRNVEEFVAWFIEDDV